MPRLKHRVTGSVVNVPSDKVDGLYAIGYDPEGSAKKAPAKKAAAKKSSK